MGSLRQAWATIQRYFAQLSGKDRLLIGTLLVTGVMVLVMLGAWSARPATVPLLPDMGPDANARAVEALKEADIAYQVKDGKVYVAPEKRMVALAYLQQAGKMPDDTQTLFQNLIKNQNWMNSKDQSDRIANAALCEMLSAVVTNFKGVEKAAVIIDAPESIGFGTTYRKPTASVGVTMHANRTLDKQLVDAIAALVSGAKAGLAIESVRVVDLRNGRQFTAVSEDSFRSGDYLENVVKQEDRLQKKVGEIVSRFDPLAIVAATVQVENSDTRTTTDKVLPIGKGGGSVTAEIRNHTEKTTDTNGGSGSGSGSGGGNGVVSNVGADIANANSGSPGRASEHETSEVESVVHVGHEKTEKVTPSGTPTRISVMVSLSREYIVGLIKLMTPAPAASATPGSTPPAAAAEPTQTDIETMFQKEKARLEKDLTPLVQTVAKEDQATTTPRVTVTLIPVPQTGPMLGMNAAGMLGVGGVGGSSGGGGGLMAQLSNGPMIKTGFLGLLAFVALGMMLMLVKKSSKPQTLPTAEEIVGLPPMIEPADDIVGEADEGNMAMEGIELNEAELKNKKMLESIEEMVKKAPQDAAGMLTRWVNVER